MSFCFLPAALRAAQTAGITRSEADFEVFALPGRHVAPMGVKFGMKEWTLVHSSTPNPLLHAKFYRHRCNNKGIGPPNAKFLLRFYQKLEYKRPAGRIRCEIFTKFVVFVDRSSLR